MSQQSPTPATEHNTELHTDQDKPIDELPVTPLTPENYDNVTTNAKLTLSITRTVPKQGSKSLTTKVIKDIRNADWVTSIQETSRKDVVPQNENLDVTISITLSIQLPSESVTDDTDSVTTALSNHSQELFNTSKITVEDFHVPPYYSLKQPRN